VNFALVNAPNINAPKQFGSEIDFYETTVCSTVKRDRTRYVGQEGFVAGMKERMKEEEDRPAVFEWLVPGVRAVLSSVCCLLSISTLLL